jgi:hypothetical protein
MNAKQIFASVSLLIAAGAAMAEPAGLTREQVRADVMRARASGELDITEANFPVVPATVSHVTREQVRNEAIAARAAGQLDLNETNYPPQPAATSTRTRAEVKAEVLAARASGELDLNETNYPGFFDARVQHASSKTLTAGAKAATSSGK